MFLPCSSLALPLLFPCSSIVLGYGSVQEVSEPSLESPRPPEWWQGQGNGEASRTSLASPFPCPCHHSPVRPPGGSLADCSSFALSLLAVCSLLDFQHFVDISKMKCYAIVIIDLRIFTFCPKSQIFLNKLCLSNWLKIAGYMFCNISPPKEKSASPKFG